MIDSNSLHQNNKRFRFDQIPSSSIPQIKKPKSNITKIASIYIKTLDIPLVSKSVGSSIDLIHLRPYKPYTLGRNPRNCDFIFKDRQVSKQHFQLYFDALNEKVFIADGVFWLCSSQFSGVRVSLNGVFVDGVRIGEGQATELCAGNEVSLVCVNDGFCSVGVRVGFVVERIVFMEEVIDNNVNGRVKNGLRLDNDIFRLGWGGLGVASVLLSRCRNIMSSSDPVWYIREHVASSYEMRAKFVRRNSRNRVTNNSCFMQSNLLEFGVTDPPKVNHFEDLANDLCKDTCSGGTRHLGLVFSPKETLEVSEENQDLVYETNDRELPEFANERVPSNGNANDRTRGIFACEEDFPLMNQNRSRGVCVPPPGNKFYLNRLGQSAGEDEICVSLPELLHPVETLVQMFIATFTSDITWFLSYCEIPAHLPVTIACHNAERCWSSSLDKRTSMPYSGFPNLVVVYPPFPESIAFGKDRKRHGIACHHPKLFVLQRKDSIRVIITSANLVAKQWHRVTNTVWWQDFPHASAPDYMALFTQSSGEEINRDSKSDFAAQLAGFMASLVADAPGQDHWVMELAKYDFQGAAGHLVASVPGVYSSRHPYISDSTYYLCGDWFMPQFSLVELLGSVEASVVGISHLFRTSVDSRGAQLKKLTAILGNCHVNAYGMLEIILRRNRNILADPNAVSVVIANSNEFSEGDSVQLGFLPRDVAKWVAPLSDSGLFAFSAYLYPKEVLASAFEGSNNKVQLILYVSQGPNFSNLTEAEQPAHGSAICSLVASIQRRGGLWRLHEVLGHYKWPEYSETDFSFGSSSIGAVNTQFLAAFSAATGKRSRHFPDSEESDPDWGGWSASQESRHPSIRIIFPTIERVKTANCGIFPSKYLLCFSQKTWLRLRTLGILHDAVPYPVERIGHPMHVKVARRRFQSKMDTSSCGWVYCGSHNFSAAAWGRPLGARTNSVLGSRLHISNYELGIVFIVPPPDGKTCTNIKSANLDDIVLPFVVPAPKYSLMDKPATKQAMREALTELSVQERENAEAAAVGELVEEEMPDEEEMVLEEASDFIAQEKEDEKAYAETLWVQVDSCES